jgi:hypothetical protein
MCPAQPVIGTRGFGNLQATQKERRVFCWRTTIKPSGLSIEQRDQLVMRGMSIEDPPKLEHV